jgi:hypothetical protein
MDLQTVQRQSEGKPVESKYPRILQMTTKHLPYSFGGGGWRPTTYEERNIALHTSLVWWTTKRLVLLGG